MKKITLLVCAVIVSVNAFGQTPSWLWARNAAGKGEGYAIAVDLAGNSYATGYFMGASITFGSAILTNVNANTSDIFIVKYDASGNVVWAARAGGSGNDEVYGIAINTSGECYITGRFNTAPITFGTTTLNNTGGWDAYVAKYDASGNAAWAVGGNGNYNDIGVAISADTAGNCFVTGSFTSSSLTFGSTLLTNAAPTFNDIFVLKLDVSGNIAWAVRVGGTDNDIGQGIAADANGNCFITGGFASSSIAFGSTILNNTGGNDIFIARYNSSGSAQWATSVDASADDEGKGITLDASGNCFITGGFQSPYLTFTGIPAVYNTGVASYDFFVAEYSSSGNVIWAAAAGGAANDYGYSVDVDAAGNAYVTGYFSSTSVTIGSNTLNLAGITDIFVAKYDVSGNALWGIGVGAVYDDAGFGMGLDASGNCYVTGSFYGSSISFGSNALSNPVNNYDVFVAKLGDIPTSAIETYGNEILFLSPNPATSEIKIKNAMSVEIFNTLGEKVYSKAETFHSTAETINVSALSSGIYFVRVRTSDGMSAGKFVKE